MKRVRERETEKIEREREIEGLTAKIEQSKDKRKAGKMNDSHKCIRCKPLYRHACAKHEACTNQHTRTQQTHRHTDTQTHRHTLTHTHKHTDRRTRTRTRRDTQSQPHTSTLTN